ncbi:S8 family serine peptidase [bacterium]|nr:S8 family serine peptidase [bacterium]
MKVQTIHPVLQPRLQRPKEWKQGAADVVTLGVASVAGAFWGPIAGAGVGAAGGAAAESMLVGEFSSQHRTPLIARQAAVGLAAGLGASTMDLLLGTVHPALNIGLGLALGGAAAALLPNRPKSAIQDHWANLETTQAPELWQRGLTGQGVGVAVLDTGIDNHPSLQGNIVAYHNFVGNEQNIHDDHHHGTAMSGIVSGLGRNQEYPAVAPNSQLIALKVADAAGRVQVDKIAEAIRWATENRERYNIRVLNMSFAADPGDDPVQLAEISKAVDEASAKGMIVVASAGNDGPEPSPMMAPAAASTALAVASQDCFASNNSAHHQLSEFSHRSPESSLGPTVTAPGSGWLQPVTGGGYLSDSGTSQAAAALSGVMALWTQAVPTLTAAQAKAALVHTSVSLQAGPEAQGAGSVRARAGLDYLLAQP